MKGDIDIGIDTDVDIDIDTYRYMAVSVICGGGPFMGDAVGPCMRKGTG